MNIPRHALQNVRHLGFALLSLGLLTGLLMPSGLASAATALCTGYTGCTAAGYTTHGYEANARLSFWRMDPGHNCTNYAAFVLSQINHVAEPAGLLGHAEDWDTNAPPTVTVNTTPAVGAIAQWEVRPGSTTGHGHVAYVEAFNANAVIVSEDTFNGDFHWRSYSRTGNEAPSAYIHFQDIAKQNDFNADGYTDLLSLNNTGGGSEYTVALSNSSSFQNPSQWANLPGWGWSGVKPLSGDFDGDGISDVGSVTNAGTSLTNVAISHSTRTSFDPPSNWATYNWDWNSMKVLAGDFNGDRKADLFSLNNAGNGVQYVVATSTGSGFNTPSNWTNLPGWGWNGMKPLVGDFNGDGKDDIASVNNMGNYVDITVSISIGSGFQAPQSWKTLGWSWDAMKVLAADFNGDGKDDFLSLNNGGTGVEYVVATSTGSSFNNPAQWANLQGWGWNGMKPFAGDFNGRGQSDIASVNNAGPSNVSIPVSLSSLNQFQTPSNWLNLPWSWNGMNVPTSGANY